MSIELALQHGSYIYSIHHVQEITQSLVSGSPHLVAYWQPPPMQSPWADMGGGGGGQGPPFGGGRFSLSPQACQVSLIRNITHSFYFLFIMIGGQTHNYLLNLTDLEKSH